MLNVDTFLTIGKTHKMCEDYIIQETAPFPFIVLCDGCSSSKDTDIGARILAVSMRNAIKAIKPLEPDRYEELGILSLHWAKNIIREMDLPLTTLDATAIVAIYEEPYAHVFMYGDGVIIHKHNDMYSVYKIDFTNGAPYYLSYKLDLDRLAVYSKASENEPEGKSLRSNHMIFSVNGDRTLSNVELYHYSTPIYRGFPLDKGDFLAVSSDGLDAFVDISTGERVPLQEIVTEMLAYKNTTGDFVKRRTKKAIETFAKSSIFPMDDVSIGTIHRPEEIYVIER